MCSQLVNLGSEITYIPGGKTSFSTRNEGATPHLGYIEISSKSNFHNIAHFKIMDS